MKPLASRLRRLDGALADLPLEEPMLLSELDGFLTGILVSPVPISPAEWMQSVWGSDADGVPPFEDPLDVQWFADAVTARAAEIARDLNRGRLQPLFDVDERSGDVLWEPWIDSFAEAMALRPEDWDGWADGADAVAAQALATLATLIAVAHDMSPLDSMQINALEETAPAAIADAVRQLHAARLRDGAAPPITSARAPQAKIGRNDPCACGSGRKSKRCCGQA